MAEFSPVIDDFWQTSAAAEGVSVVINPELPDDRRVTIVTLANGAITASVTPEMASHLGLNSPGELDELSLRQAIAKADVDMHEGDLIFYFTNDAQAALLDESAPSSVRRLSESDASLFQDFEAAASAQDLDDAYVELDHWAVFGSFEDDRLVAAASAYPWRGSKLADIGVLTLPAYRGMGHGRAVVRALSRHAYGEGYEPQYRCQVDNHASRGTARSAGLTQYGTWEWSRQARPTSA